MTSKKRKYVDVQQSISQKINDYNQQIAVKSQESQQLENKIEQLQKQGEQNKQGWTDLQNQLIKLQNEMKQLDEKINKEAGRKESQKRSMKKYFQIYFIHQKIEEFGIFLTNKLVGFGITIIAASYYIPHLIYIFQTKYAYFKSIQ